MRLISPINLLTLPLLVGSILSNPILNNSLTGPIIPAICSSIIVSPIAYSVDKAVVNSSLNCTPIHKEIKKSLKTLKSKESIITFSGLVTIFTISNIINNRLVKLAICSILLTPIGILKDIRMSNIDNKQLVDINKRSYYGFMIRDTISLVSALLFPSNINLIVYYLCILMLQIPQTYFHQFGLEYCNQSKHCKSGIPIIKGNFANNVVIRSIKNIIQYGIGMKLNLIFIKLL